MRDKKKLIEAALFIAARPMTLAELYHVVGIPKPEIEKLLAEMEKEYGDHGIGIRKREAGYEIHIKEEYKANVEHLAPEKDFSKATLQTLSLIAYHHPAKQSFVVETRGNRAYDHIKELTSRGFIRVEPEGHTNRLYVTKKFLEYFSLSSTAELKDYFKDQGVEPPDEEKWEKVAEKDKKDKTDDKGEDIPASEKGKDDAEKTAEPSESEKE